MNCSSSHSLHSVGSYLLTFWAGYWELHMHALVAECSMELLWNCIFTPALSVKGWTPSLLHHWLYFVYLVIILPFFAIPAHRMNYLAIPMSNFSYKSDNRLKLLSNFKNSVIAKYLYLQPQSNDTIALTSVDHF